MTAVVSPCPRMKRRALSASCPVDPEQPPLDPEEPAEKRRLESAPAEKRKRSASCSTRSSASSGKRHKKKKKKRKHRERDPPSPRVNPIFLWVKQDDTKIVEVLCEDYDRRNRITLTKTAGGWRAIPHTDRLSRQSSSQLQMNGTKDTESESEDRLSDYEEETHPPELQPPEPIPSESVPSEEERLAQPPSPESQPDEELQPPLITPKPAPTADIYEFHEDSDEERPPPVLEKAPVRPKEELCESEKCREMNNGISIADENHNTDFHESIVNSNSDDKLVAESDNPNTNTLISDAHSDVDKELEDLIDELEEDSDLNNKDEPDCKDHCMIESSLSEICLHVCDDVLNEAEKESNDFSSAETVPCIDNNECSNLIEELEEMCHDMIEERLNEGSHEPEKVEEKEEYLNIAEKSQLVESKTFEENTPNIIEPNDMMLESEKVKEPQNKDGVPEATESPIPINLVVDKSSPEKLGKDERIGVLMSQETPDISLTSIYRLPEGTTIHKSNSILMTESHKLTTEDRKRYLDKVLNIVPPERPTLADTQVEPLNLGKVKKEKSPSPVCQRPKSAVVKQEKVKTKSDDITLKTILNNPRAKDTSKTELEMAAELSAHSKLMELLSHESKEKVLDPSAQLKEILSDPNMVVPDPLLVPRARLAALVANPAKEIPRLLVQNQAYSRVDPDLLVVSISHLQSMLQNCKGELQAPLVQPPMPGKMPCQPGLDPAQMLWLPYLGQLEAMTYGSSQDFLSALNMVNQYPQGPYRQPPAHGYDYATQQQMFSVWQDMMQKPNLSYTKNSSAKLYEPYSAYFKQPAAKAKSSMKGSPYYRGGEAGVRGAPSQMKVSSPKQPKTEPVESSSPAPKPKVSDPPKLKVKDHLVDPNVRPQLLKFGDSPHPLWHPLFSSHEGGKTYSSPWQWTTPVTVNGD